MIQKVDRQPERCPLKVVLLGQAGPIAFHCGKKKGHAGMEHRTDAIVLTLPTGLTMIIEHGIAWTEQGPWGPSEEAPWK